MKKLTQKNTLNLEPMPKVYYILYYSTEKNFGKAINDHVAQVGNNDDFICIIDGDSMFLTPDWGVQIEQVINTYGKKFSLIGCMTNRLGRKIQIAPGVDYDNHDTKYHYGKAVEFARDNFGIVEDISKKRYIAGLFMLFPKSVWNKHKFKENTPSFDDEFSKSVRRGGGKLGLMKGLYCQHWYRGWSDEPKTDRGHLL